MVNYNPEYLKKLQNEINRMDPVDIAERFELLSEEEVAIWIKLLSKDLLADSFAELKADDKVRIIKILSEEKIKELVRELDEDELVDTLQELPANLVRKAMATDIEPERREIVNELLGYPEDSVGSIMTVNFLSVKASQSPKEALEKIMRSDLDAEKLEQIWLTNESLVLIGYIKIADLVRNQNGSLEDISNSITIKVNPTDNQELVARLSYKYNLAEVPVIDSENRLIGIIPSEDVIDVVHEELQEDMSNITGISDQSESYLEENVFKLAKTRVTWLVICLITATMTSFIIQKYEALLASYVILTAYIPMLMDSGGNSGSQSSTTVITNLYSSKLDNKNISQVILKEIQVGAVVGLTLVAINLIRMIALGSSDIQTNLIVSFTLFVTIVFSNVMGGILPLIADKINVDPTVMAGPLITTIVDTCVLLIYFQIASVVLGI